MAEWLKARASKACIPLRVSGVRIPLSPPVFQKPAKYGQNPKSPELCHATLMSVQAFRNLIASGGLVGVAALVIIGVALIVLAPARSVERESAAKA